MIFVLILIAWLTIVAIIVNACRSAARGDRLLANESSATPQLRARIGIDAGALGLTATQHLQRVHAGAFGGRGERVRGGGCATGS
ncbi:MAG TPA: hypothetical protein VFY36_01055 [Solirubrobacteraceae bacterium]|nr:hypothetical protein [Solirubrobacteraceae bacterium]